MKETNVTLSGHFPWLPLMYGCIPISGRTRQKTSGCVSERLDRPAPEMERRGGDHLPAGAFGQRLDAVDLKAELIFIEILIKLYQNVCKTSNLLLTK